MADRANVQRKPGMSFWFPYSSARPIASVTFSVAQWACYTLSEDCELSLGLPTGRGIHGSTKIKLTIFETSLDMEKDPSLENTIFLQKSKFLI